MRRLLIRADANPEMGTGHVMRCLALAQAWQDTGGEASFVVAYEMPKIEPRLIAEGFSVHHISAAPGSEEDAVQTDALAVSMKACFVVVDGYHFGSQYQRLIKGSGNRLLFIDDYGHAGSYCSDLVLNQNLYATEDLYKKREPFTQLLLGPSFVLLRREFNSWHGLSKKTPHAASKVLVTLGGSDPDNVTLKVIESLQSLAIGGIEVTAVVGGSNAHANRLEAAAKDSRIPLRLVRSATNMQELMAWADMAISSGGTTSWEMAFMGLPALIVVLAENQAAVAEKLEHAGAALNLGWHDELTCQKIRSAVENLMIDSEKRESISRRGQQLVDGFGANRVVDAIWEKIIHFRYAAEDDCELIYKWANDAEARAASFHPGIITLEEHRSWFHKKLMNPDCIFLISLDDAGTPIGEVRFDLEGDEAIMSINIGREFRGNGLASPIIHGSVNELFRRSSASRVNAFIKVQNLRSAKAFERAGFSRIEQKSMGENDAYHYLKTRNV